jgi:apolipoprotein D and lipocalin family protein
MILTIKERFPFMGMVLLSLALQGGCAGIPEGATAVTGFELDRYLGQWYEVARLDHRFERDLTNVTASYSMREDGGVNVLNRGYKVDKGEWQEATGKAYFVGNTDVGQLKVTFFGPFYGGYNIIELDKDAYQYALIAGPDRGYLWILSRSPQLDPTTLSALINKADNLDFPTDQLIYVDHTAPRNSTGQVEK